MLLFQNDVLINKKYIGYTLNLLQKNVHVNVSGVIRHSTIIL